MRLAGVEEVLAYDEIEERSTIPRFAEDSVWNGGLGI